MNGALYIGATGMKSLAEGMNVVSNNIANANTLGFKQQNMLFSDLMSQGQGGMGGWWGAQQGSYVAVGQVGMGVQVDSVRTLFTQGSYEMGSDVTDMSINGKGFFEVTQHDGQKLYTRAGNFRFNNEGFLNLPDGATLSGFPLDAEGNKSGPAGPIQINPLLSSPAKATTQVTLSLNLGVGTDSSDSATDPYFGLVQKYNSEAAPPLNKDSYGYTQALRVYDAAGTPQDLTIYIDGTPQHNAGKTLEFVVSTNAAAPATGSEALMTGTLTFNAQGELVDMSAFTPGGGDVNDLNNWTPAPMQGGSPQFTMNGQAVSLDLGLKAPGAWTNPPATAAEVGADRQKLPSMGTGATRSAQATTGYAGSSSQKMATQDGYSEGKLSRVDIEEDGKLVATFSNGQTQPIFEIPVCRFTSEDGLRREGSNYFSAPPAAGQMEMGRASTENYGRIVANTLESSNVDMAREMVNMIMTQRGFQSNSKAVSTADTMLQKAIELKR